MSDDLIDRLRECAECKSSEAWGRLDGGQDLCIGAALAAEAADELARLRAEVERLQAHSYRLERWLRSNMQEKTANLARAVRAEAALSDERAHADALMDDVRQRLSYDAETFHDQGAWDREDACLAIMKRIDLHRARRQG